MESLLTQMIDEQRKTNELLSLLIDALAESEVDEEAEPSYHLDGTQCR